MSKVNPTRKYNRLFTSRKNYYALGDYMSRPPSFAISSSNFHNYRGNKAATANFVKSANNNGANIDPNNLPGSLGGGKIGSGIAGSIGGIAQAASGAIGSVLGGGMSSTVGDTLQAISPALSAIPGFGPLVSAGVNVLGGAVNGLFGSNINEEAVSEVENQINSLNSFTSNASDFDSLLSEYNTLSNNNRIQANQIGKEGILSNKVTDKAAELNTRLQLGESMARASITNNARNIAGNTMDTLLSNYMRFGGDLNKFSSGGSIRIKPENRGKFTETKRRTGKTTEELTHSKNPLTRKRAIFAQNAAKWKHANGGYLTSPSGSYEDTELGQSQFTNDIYDLYLDKLINDSIPLDRAKQIAKYMVMQSSLESGYGKSAGDSNYGGYLSSGHGSSKRSYKNMQDFVDHHYENMKQKWPNFIYSGNIDEYYNNLHTGDYKYSIDPKEAYLQSLRGTEKRVTRYLKDKLNDEYIPDSLIPTFSPTFDIDNWKALGGILQTKGANWNTGLNIISNGGTHEENPLEGVPMGVDAEGIPNLVEEGEVIFNDYVFSNRLKVPKGVRKKYKLKGTKPLTFADAAKQMSKESKERPNDPISKNGLEAMMANLANAQEELKAENQNRQFANRGNLFKDGGPAKYRGLGKSYNRGWFNDNGEYTQEYLNRVNNMTLSQLQDQFNRQYEYYTNPENRGSQRWQSIHNFYSKNPKYNRADYNVTESDLAWAKSGAQDYNPGYLHDIVSDATTPTATPTIPTQPSIIDPVEEKEEEISKYFYNTGTRENPNYVEYTEEDAPVWMRNNKYFFTSSDKQGNTTNYFYDPWKEPEQGKYVNWLRYAPAVGFGIGAITDTLGLTNRPDYSNADAIFEATRGSGTYQPVKFNPIGNYLRYTPFDRKFYINQMNAQAGATRRAMLQNAGMNRGAGMAALLAADANAQNQLGALARQAEEYNLAQRQQVEDFNRGTNITNSQGFLQADIANQKAQTDMRDFNFRGTMAAAQMREAARQASDAARSANLSGLFQTLGDIGYEEKSARMLENLINSGYVPGGDRFTFRAKGGKIKRKKKGLTF